MAPRAPNGARRRCPAVCGGLRRGQVAKRPCFWRTVFELVRSLSGIWSHACVDGSNTQQSCLIMMRNLKIWARILESCNYLIRTQDNTPLPGSLTSRQWFLIPETNEAKRI
eukprot:6191979-Pleurochrysis_carterae.AAC.1